MIMKKLIVAIILSVPVLLNAQDDKAVFKSYEPGFYQNFILRDVRHVDASLNEKAPEKRFLMDQSVMKLPNDRNLYEEVWAQPTLSQGNAGTCWAYGGTSFFESEVHRLQQKEVKLSEMFTVYWEYVEKAREYVRSRGESHFSQGSQANAVTRMIQMHGAVPQEVYSGLLNNRKYHSHDAMVEEMNQYLSYVKANAIWNEDQVISTIRSILDYHMGEIPESFTFDGKSWTPESFRDNYLKINANDYVDVMSTLATPYHQKGKYNVPDNWWNCENYTNLPLDEYMDLLNSVLDAGFSVAIGGDVSEAGFSRETNVALIPDFDIASKDINAYAREFRFQNRSSTDDHIMHIIGKVKFKGAFYYLVKDSSSGSRNVEQDSNAFGYYFMHEDYIRLKILTFTVHKDALK